MSLLKELKYRIYSIPFYALLLLPLPVLYLLSDVLYVLLYNVIRYRRKVVQMNLLNSFPDKDEKERARIEKAYYHSMIDVFIESFKALTLKASDIEKRVKYNEEDIERIKILKSKHNNMVLVLGHMGNWEWGGHRFALHRVYPLQALYHPLKNKFFDWFFQQFRTRFGMTLIPMQQAMKHMLSQRNQTMATAFIADQTPQPSSAQWLTFLHQDTPVFTGTEKIARKLNAPVVFAAVRRVRRGYYSVHLHLITDNPSQHQEGWITQEHTRLLEEEIKRQPEIWLWSHRRWKHKRLK